jgi:hypothetical protein
MAPNIGGHWCGGVVLRGCEAGTRQPSKQNQKD